MDVAEISLIGMVTQGNVIVISVWQIGKYYIDLAEKIIVFCCSNVWPVSSADMMFEYEVDEYKNDWCTYIIT